MLTMPFLFVSAFQLHMVQIYRKSILANVENFNICQSFPQHKILFEGVVPYKTKLLLKVLIHVDERMFFNTIRELNQRLGSFDYGYMNTKNKPTPIAKETINVVGDTKHRQSGK